jgi:hypothetical protein
MKLWQRKLILSIFIAVFCITALPSSQAKESDGQNFVVLFHRGFVDWFWKVPPSVDVTNYSIVVTGGGSDSTFTTTDSYFVPANHGLTNPNDDKQICVNANLSDGWGFGSCAKLASGKPSGQVINFDGGPAPIYKINGVFQDSIHSPYEVRRSEPKGISGKSFAATDSVFLNTNVYYLEPPYTSKFNICDLDKKCVENTKVVSDYWAINISPNYTTATVSTPDACQVVRSKINENSEMVTEIRPLRDNVDCSVIATSHVPFLAQPDTTANFTIHFQKLPYSLLVQLPNGEVNPTVGTTTFLFAQQVPQWNWLKERKYSFASSIAGELNFSKEFRSLTPKTCSIKRPDLYILELRGITVGKCAVEISFPQQMYLSSIVSDADTRTLNFNISKPKVRKDVVTKYPCMIAEPAASLFTILNLTNKSAVPKNCQNKNDFIWTPKS